MDNFLDLFRDDLSQVKEELVKFSGQLSKDPGILNKQTKNVEPMFWLYPVSKTEEEAKSVTPKKLQTKARIKQQIEKKVAKIIEGS